MQTDSQTHSRGRIDEWTIDGDTFTTRETLRFPDDATIRRGLDAAGLGTEHSWGDWDGSPVTAASPERIVMARKPLEPVRSAPSASSSARYE